MKFPKWISQAAVGLLLLGGTGCSKQMSSPAGSGLGNSNTTQTASADQAAPVAGKKSSPTSADKAIGASLVPEQVVIPSGTVITVRLQNAVSSATSTPGDQFEATLDQPIMVNGQTIAPEGAHVTGRVVAARRSGRLMHSGYLRIALSSLTLDGKSIPVQSSSVMVAGMSHKKRNLDCIGGGAGGGALIGAIATGGTGALSGSAIGAAGGTTTAYATGKKDVGFGPERRLTFS